MNKKEIPKNGVPSPLGTTKVGNQVNFALFSHSATQVKLLLFKPNTIKPFKEFTLDPKCNKTGSIWHVGIDDVQEGTEYAYKIDGPHIPKKGLLFNKSALILDPYAKELNTSHIWESKRKTKGEHPLLGRISTPDDFDWEGDQPPKIPYEELVIYEMHVRAFTRDQSSQTASPGTFSAMIEKIPYLKELGINAVELMPVFEFNECEYGKIDPVTKQMLCNFWGYSTMNFFSLMHRYAVCSEPSKAKNEFKTLIKALHQAGIEVILDVVYNHTAEGNEKGPLISFRGIDNPSYYILDNEGHYQNYSGCGNTLSCNHAPVTQMILDSLRYWVTEFHVDGFRFDLASAMNRGEDGSVLSDPAVIHMISEDPLLKNVKLIAEAWDAAGLYQVGSFPAHGRWLEWNGKYRDRVRAFIKGTDGMTGDFAQSLCGSPDLYQHDRKPYHSINFITAHDGFTLRDLVSYKDKHNERNGEHNGDGDNNNQSWNYGVEGETSESEILTLRLRQMRNFHVAMLVSIGTPMLSMGDEYGHTRVGNNNTWCQDNQLNWFLWNHLNEEQEFNRFYRQMINFRKTHPILRRTEYIPGSQIIWHGLEPMKANWGNENRFLAYTLKDPKKQEHLYIAFNCHHFSVDLQLPTPPRNKKWLRVVDTSLPSPDDFVENPQSLSPLKKQHTLPAHSCMIAKAL